MNLLGMKRKLLPLGNPQGGDGGGGGGGGPTSSTSYNTNIPEYAKPYVTGMLESAQKQIYNDDRTSFRPYTPYSNDVNNYFAGFSPLQQQAQYDSANMQQPGQFAMGSGLAGAAGIGSLGAGQQYNQNVTDPARMQSFMSPYQQSVTDVAKTAAVREAQIAQNASNLGAARQGTYGGARQTLAQSEREKNLLSNLSNIQTQGSQSAFDRATQSQQFGSNLGMQGYGQAINAGSMLGQLGGQQQATDIARQNQMSQMGKQQQDLEQSKINQAIQTYAIQQQYPQMQLGFLSNMLRGLPLQAQTTQLYQAQPSITQQATGLIGAGATLFGGRKEGGAIKEMAKGGITGYKYGGAIPEPKLESMADSLSVQQLQQRIKDPALTPGERQVFQEALASKQQVAARSSGIAAAGGGLFDTMGYAGGGILAFTNEGAVKDPEELVNQINLIGTQLDAINKEAAGANAPGLRQKTYKPDESAKYENLKARQGELKNEYAGLMSKAGLDKPAFNYQPSRSLGAGATANPVEQVLSGNKPATTSAMPTEGEFKAFDEATQRFLAEQKTKPPSAAGPSTGSQASKASSAQANETSGLSSILAGLRKEGPKGELGSGYLDKLKAFESGAGERLSEANRLARAKGYLKFGSTAAPGGIGQAALAGLTEYTDQYGKAVESDEKFRMENAKLQADIQNLQRAEERGDVKLASEIRDRIEDRANRLQTANISAAASGRASARDDAYVKQLMGQGMSLEQALQAVKGAGRAEANDVARAKAALTQINEQLLLMKKDDPARAALIAQRDQITKSLTSGGSMQTAGGGGVPKDIQGILDKYQQG